MINNGRKTITKALFELLREVKPFPDIPWATARRHLKVSQATRSFEQPALFLRYLGETNTDPQLEGLHHHQLHFGCLVYVRANTTDTADDDDPPEDLVLNVLDEIDGAVNPAPLIERQTLGGLVENCFITEAWANAGLTDPQCSLEIVITVVTGIQP